MDIINIEPIDGREPVRSPRAIISGRYDPGEFFYKHTMIPHISNYYDIDYDKLLDIYVCPHCGGPARWDLAPEQNNGNYGLACCECKNYIDVDTLPPEMTEDEFYDWCEEEGWV